jgi:YVTN family beta-propeller protein
VPVGNNPYGVAVNAISNLVFDTNNGSNSTSIIDGTSNTVSQTLAVGNGPQGVGFNPATLTAYVANGGSNTVSVLAVFAGTPKMSNCHGKTVSALAHQFGGLNAAATALGFSSVQALQDSIKAFCGQ